MAGWCWWSDKEDETANDDDYNDDKDDYNDDRDDDGGFYLRLPQPPLPKASSSRDPHSLNLPNPDDDDANDDDYGNYDADDADDDGDADCGDDDDDDDEGVCNVVCPRIRLHQDWSEVKSFAQPSFFRQNHDNDEDGSFTLQTGRLEIS